MFRFDVRATALTGFVAGEEDDTTSFFRISLEHRASRSWRDSALRPPVAECATFELPLSVLGTVKRKVGLSKTPDRTFLPRSSCYSGSFDWVCVLTEQNSR